MTNIIQTPIKGVQIIEPKVFEDHRGYFFESFKSSDYQKQEFIQDNESKSSKNVLRGLHYQLPPFAQTKLVRVIFGEILDVAVDIRRDSNTFGQWFKIVLNNDNKRQLLIPKGCAHGFIVLSDMAIVNYKVDAPYSPKHEDGIKFDDKRLAIDWGLKDTPIVSAKDEVLPSFKPNELKEINWQTSEFR